MSTQEREAESHAQDNATPNGSTPPTLTRTNTEEAINDMFSLYVRPSRIIEDNENTSSSTDSLQSSIRKSASRETVVTEPDDGNDEPASFSRRQKPKRSNRISPPAEPLLPVGYPPSFFQLGLDSNPESSNSLLGYADPRVTIQSLNQPVHETDLERYQVEARASGDDAGLLTAVGLSTFTTPLSVTSTLYTHDLVITQDKGKGKADPSDNDNKNRWPPPSLDKDDDDRDFNLTDLKIYRDAAAWKTTRMQLGEAGPSRMPYTSQVEDEENEGKSDWEEPDDSQPSSRRIAESKSGDHDEFVASSDEEYSKSQDSDWSLSKSALPPPVKVKCKKASKRKFSDWSSDESEQPTKRKRSEKAVCPSRRKVKGHGGKKIEADYEDISSPRIAVGTSKSSLGKRKRKSTRDDIPIVQRKTTRRIIESSEYTDSSPAESSTASVKTKKKKTKQVKPSHTQNSDSHSRNLCPEKNCGRAFVRQTDLKRHVRGHPPSRYTIPWFQAHGVDLSNGFASGIRCTVPQCRRPNGDYHMFGRLDALVRHQKAKHESLLPEIQNSKSNIRHGEWKHVNVERYMN